jgi:hypothetical protein
MNRIKIKKLLAVLLLAVTGTLLLVAIGHMGITIVTGITTIMSQGL